MSRKSSRIVGFATGEEFEKHVKHGHIAPAISDEQLKSRMGTRFHIDTTNYDVSTDKAIDPVHVPAGEYVDVPIGQILKLPYRREKIDVFGTGKSTHARRPVFVSITDEEGKMIPHSPIDMNDNKVQYTTNPVGRLKARVFSPSHPIIVGPDELIAQLSFIYNMDEAHVNFRELSSKGILSVFDDKGKEIIYPKLDKDGNVILTLDLRHRDTVGNSFYVSIPTNNAMDFSESGYDPQIFYEEKGHHNGHYKYPKGHVLLAYSKESVEMGNQERNGVSAFMPLLCLAKGMQYSNFATRMQPSPSADGKGHKRLFEAWTKENGNNTIELKDGMPFALYVAYKNAGKIPGEYRRSPNDSINGSMLRGRNRHGEQVFSLAY